MLGRVTLNPLPHIDPWMSLLLPALLWFGSARARSPSAAPSRCRSTPGSIRNYRRGDILVSAAGVTTNLVLALRLRLRLRAAGPARSRSFPARRRVLDTAQRMMVYGIWLNLMLCFFNLIPIPPLDGSHLLYHSCRPGWALVPWPAALRLSSALRADVPLPAGHVSSC